jgi:hypothetical protein
VGEMAGDEADMDLDSDLNDRLDHGSARIASISAAPNLEYL